MESQNDWKEMERRIHLQARNGEYEQETTRLEYPTLGCFRGSRSGKSYIYSTHHSLHLCLAFERPLCDAVATSHSLLSFCGLRLINFHVFCNSFGEVQPLRSCGSKELTCDVVQLAKAMDGEIHEDVLTNMSKMGRELATKAGMKVPEGKSSGKEQ